MDAALSPLTNIAEEILELPLRPQSFAEYVGQRSAKEALSLATLAARQRKQPLDHVLLYGPPGLGKTSLATIIAKEMEASLRTTAGPAITKAGDLAALLTNLAPGDVLFIDEIHRLPRTVEEVLYPAMEDRCLDILIGKGPGARSLRLDLPPFTLVGATTRAGSLSQPLRERFGLSFHLDYYELEELIQILKRSSQRLGLSLNPEGLEILAASSRRTPRVANRLLRRVRDFAQVGGHAAVDASIVRTALDQLEVDELGLDRTDRALLKIIGEQFGGGPVGLETLAAATGEEVQTIEDVVEPYLLRLGFLERTPRGRSLSDAGRRHLGFPVPIG